MEVPIIAKHASKFDLIVTVIALHFELEGERFLKNSKSVELSSLALPAFVDFDWLIRTKIKYVGNSADY